MKIIAIFCDYFLGLKGLDLMCAFLLFKQDALLKKEKWDTASNRRWKCHSGPPVGVEESQ